MGSLRRKCEAFFPPVLSVPRHQLPPNCSPRHTASRSSASIEQISIAHRCADLAQSKGFGHSHSPKVDGPPAPFSSPTHLARTFVDRHTDTAHHVAFSSLAPREFLLFFSDFLWFKTLTSLHQKTAPRGVVIEGVCDSAKPTRVVCAPKPHPSSIFISTLDLAGSHTIGSAEHRMFISSTDPCPK